MKEKDVDDIWSSDYWYLKWTTTHEPFEVFDSSVGHTEFEKNWVVTSL